MDSANIANNQRYTALEAAADAAHADCVQLLGSHGARNPAAPTPAATRQEAARKGEPFHWEPGRASQAWWEQEGMPQQSRRCRELLAQ